MEEKVIRKSEGCINMPKKIEIGDPLYFETGEGLKLTYSKSFRGKQEWACSLEVKENIVTYPADDMFPTGLTFNEVNFTVYLAYNEDMLNLIKQGKIYSRQIEKATMIGVDTARYKININNDEYTIRTGGDGFVGGVYEYYTKSKLEAIVIDISIPEESGYRYESAKELLGGLFDCTLQDVTIE